MEKNIIEHIIKTRKQAIKEHIKANTIIIDSEIAKINGFYLVGNCLNNVEVPTMFLGLKVEYIDNLSNELGIDTNFVLLEKEEPQEKTLSDYSTDELLDELKRRCTYD